MDDSWTELTHASDKYNMLVDMNTEQLQSKQYIPGNSGLQKPGLALPTSNITVKLNVMMAGHTGTLSACVFCVIFLDTDKEEDLLKYHEYLINKFNFQITTVTNVNAEANLVKFKLSTKELVLVMITLPK